MRILQLFNHLYIIELDVQELVHGFQYTLDGDVIFKLDGDFVVDKGLEEARGEDCQYEHCQVFAVNKRDKGT